MILNLLAQAFDPANLESVLLWVINGVGATYLTGRFVALLLENLPAWHNFHPYAKLASTMLISVAISIGAQVLLDNPDLVTTLSPWFTLVMQAVLAWLGSQQQYLSIKAVNKDTPATQDYGIKPAKLKASK